MCSIVLVALNAFAQPVASDQEAMRLLRTTIGEIRFSGNTLVSTDELRAVVAPFIGPDRTVRDFEAMQRAVLEAYRARGYAMVTLSLDPRNPEPGIYRVLVNEVRIGRVTVSGNRYFSEANLRSALPGLVEGEAPNLSQVARSLFLANDNPARTLALDFKSGQAGTTDVEIKATEQNPQRFALALDNTGTAATGRFRIGGIATHSNLWDRGHSAALSVTTSNRPSRVGQFGLYYQVPLAALGDAINLSASYSDVNSGRVADAFNISGQGSTLGAHYQHSLYRDSQTRHVLDIGYDERHFRNVIDFFGTNLGVDVNARPVSIAWQYRTQGAASSSAASVAYSHNLSGGSKNDDATYAASRAGAQANWDAWRASLAWQSLLSGNWLTAIRAEAQYARTPLISGEQFALGGLRAVRGFTERESAGDRGWRANFELYTPPFWGENRVLGFVDTGRQRRLNVQPGEQAGEGVSSVGLGWRYALKSGGPNLALDWAIVIDGTPQNGRGEQMLHFSLAWWF